MADTTLLFDELLRSPSLRAKSYIVQEDQPTGLACVELMARRGEDWFFARRWVGIRAGRRFLYWLLDEIEGHGFRFRLEQVPLRRPDRSLDATQPWALASVNWAALSDEERHIHRELFPHEETLLSLGYDWDHLRVYRHGTALAPDAHGRWMEQAHGVLYEWVRIDDEFTWRRYPLYVIPEPQTQASTASETAAATG